MLYRDTSELPAPIRDSIAESVGRRLFMRAANDEIAKGAPAKKAFDSAWSVLKSSGYRKSADGLWRYSAEAHEVEKRKAREAVRIKKDGDGGGGGPGPAGPTPASVHVPTAGGGSKRGKLKGGAAAKEIVEKYIEKINRKPASTASMLPRWPAGTPNQKGGQFAPKGITGAGVSAMFGSGLSHMLFPNAREHPKRDENGNRITIKEPTKPTDKATWQDKSAVATFAPGGAIPVKINGIPFTNWKAPADWSKVSGQTQLNEPPMPVVPGKKPGTGVIIIEPDGRIWITRPTNGFGGYRNTFPKGGVEPNLPLQANAIKEAYEETGLKVKIVAHLGDFERDTSVARYYVAQRVGGSPANMGWESQAVRLVPPGKLADYLNRDVDLDIADTVQVSGYKIKKAFDATLFESSNGVAPELVDRMNALWDRIEKAGGKRSGGHWESQPRWPAGTPLGGQWMTMGPQGFTLPPKIAPGKDGSPSKNPMYDTKSAALYNAAVGGDIAAVQVYVAEQQSKLSKWQASGNKSSHVKYNAQSLQYAEKLVSDHVAKVGGAAAEGAKPGDKAPALTSVEGWKKVGPQLGSNPGGVYLDGDGAKHYVKFSKSDDHAKNEVLAAKLYELAGASVVQYQIVDVGGGKLGTATKWQDPDAKLNPDDAWHTAAAKQNFAVHAWLANYDAVGLAFDNQAPIQGKMTTLDTGGALIYRAQGAPKTDFGNEAKEWNSMRDPKIAAQAAKVFGDMTASQLSASVAKVAAVSDDSIRKLVMAHGPGDEKARTALAEKLIARKADIVAKGAALAPKDAQAPAVAAAAPKAAPAPKSDHIPKPKGQTQAFVYGVATDAKSTVAEKLDALAKMESSLSNPANVAYAKQVAAAIKGAAPAAKANLDEAKAAFKVAMYEHMLASQKLSAQLSKEVAEGATKIWAGHAEKAAKGELSAAAMSSYSALSPKAQQAFEQMKAAYGGTPAKSRAAAAAQPAPKLPDSASYKMAGESATAKQHNAKMDKLAQLAAAGDAEGLKAQVYVNNGPGAKQAKYANDALVAMGHEPVITKGWNSKGKVSAAPAPTSVTEKVPTAGSAAAAEKLIAESTKKVPEAKAPVFNPERLPTAPDFVNWKGAGQGLSSKAAVNQQNQALAAQLKAAASSGDPKQVDAVTFQPLDPATGAAVGAPKSIYEHPSQHIKAYAADLKQNIKDQLNPVAKVEQVAKATRGSVFDSLDKHYPAVGQQKFKSHADKIGRYLVLGGPKAVDQQSLGLTELSKKNKGLSAQKLYEQSQAAFNKLSAVERQAIRDYTGSSYGSMNASLKSGNPNDMASKALNGLSKASVPLQPGTMLSRKFSLPGGDDLAKMEKSVGKILQDPAIISTSMSPSVWSGNVHMRMTVGEGVKGLYVAPGPKGGKSISNYPGEDEIILPPNTRFVVTAITKGAKSDEHGTWGSGSKIIVDVLVLPNDKT